jgi:phosphoribosylformimino-5-aminoimidazole carboxamide ribotide isomerase
MATLTLYPAIDLLGGRCVRLRQGDYAQAQVFDDDPLAVARRWKEAGAEWLHVVDLDGALAGEPKHLGVVRAIVEATELPVQVGGGLRTEGTVAAAFAAGAERVILGTAAAREPELLAACLARWSERIAVSVDSRGGQLTVAGWLEVFPEVALTFAKRMARMGVRTLVVTNVERDGMLAGSDTATLAGLRAALPETRLIAAGGLASLDDVRWLASAGMDGAVLGRALYEGALDLVEALRVTHEMAANDGAVGADATNSAATASVVASAAAEATTGEEAE